MTDFEPEIVEVATTRIGPSPRQTGGNRSRRPLSVVIVIIVALAIPAIAFTGPRDEQRLDLSYLVPTPTPSPTPTPRPTPTPPPPTPSPPPALTIGEGPVPESIAIDVGGIRLVDPATGALGPPSKIRADSDAVFPAPNGGWWCVCFGRNQDDQHETVEIVVRRLDSNAVETSSSTIVTIESVADPPDQEFATHVDVELSPDRRKAFVAVAVRAPGGWTISVEAIDLWRGTSIGRKDIGFVAVTPPTADDVNQGYGTWLGGPSLRLSPEGDRLLISHWLDKNTATSYERQALSVSVIDVAASSRGTGPPGAATALGGDITASIPTCGWLQWLTNDSILGMCWREGEPSPGEAPVEVTTFGLDGSRLAGIDYAPDTENWLAEPVLDVANRRVYLWSPLGHQFDTIDLDSGRLESLTVEPDVDLVAPDGRIDWAAQSPAWATMYSDYMPWSIPALLPDPRGSRIFAVGMREGQEDGRGQTSASSGIWVFDTATLELVDHWPAAASYSGLGLSRNGRWLYAISQGGSDAEGNPSGWPPAVTIHDATDGRFVMQLAGFGTDQSLLFAP